MLRGEYGASNARNEIKSWRPIITSRSLSYAYRRMSSSISSASTTTSSRRPPIHVKGWTVDFEKPIGKGKFGEVFTAHKGKKLAAAKIETIVKSNSLESSVLRLMDGRGAPKLHSQAYVRDPMHSEKSGRSQNKTVFIMELLGKSLHQVVLAQPSSTLTLEQVLAVGVRAIDVLSRLHSKGYVHGDIKPQNLMFDRESCAGTSLEDFDVVENARKVSFIDFGLSKAWKTGAEHSPFSQSVSRFSGSLRYASVGAHLGWKLSRRDDLESLGYVLLWLLWGKLPWQGVLSKGALKAHEILLKKGSMSVEALCGNTHPGFFQYFAYIRRMEYQHEPDYELLKSMLVSGEVEKPVSLKRSFTTMNRSIKDKHSITKKNRAAVFEDDKMYQWILISTQAVAPTKNTQCIASGDSAVELLDSVKSTFASFTVSCLTYVKEFGFKAIIKPSSSSSTDEVHVLARTSTDIASWCANFLKHSNGSIAHVTSDSFHWIVVSRTKHVPQTFIFDDKFPKHWVADTWKQRQFVTLAHCFAGHWFLIATPASDCKIDSQKVEMSFGYPSASIREHWKAGYSVMTMAAGTDKDSGKDLSVWVLGKFPKENMSEQRCIRTSKVNKIHKEWEDGYQIQGIAYARTV